MKQRPQLPFALLVGLSCVGPLACASVPASSADGNDAGAEDEGSGGSASATGITSFSGGEFGSFGAMGHHHRDAGAGGGKASDAGSQGDAWTAPDVGAPVDAGSPGIVDLTLTVTASQRIQAISPYIYGVNDGSQAASVHASMVRTGGNRLTAYNWENNASNAGADYMFENDDYLCSTQTCAAGNDAPGAFLKAVVDGATAAGAGALVTVPIVDYVSADKSPAGDVRNSGSNYLQTRFMQNKPVKGSPFAFPPDATDGVVYQDEMVAWLTRTADPGANIRFLLDNEPDIWSSMHPEVHPTPVTYAELAQRSIDYATAIKAVAPSAKVIGPVSYGYEGYVSLQNATDSAADGDFFTWWLQQMSAAGTSAGQRLIDGLDMHYYSEATGGGVRIIDDGTGADEVAAREQAPRSLWDATYTENSWITQVTGGPIALIPREQTKITTYYPGTKLSFSEWNFGGGTDISGAIASADVLGIYGANGVDMAMMWPVNGDEAFTYAAFKAYRDYDGNGGAFGDTSVGATTSDVADSSVYASVQSSDPSKMVVIAINKATTSKVAGIVVDHSTVYSQASVYTITAGGGSSLVAGPGLTSVATNAFRYTMPAQSVSVIVPRP